MLFTILLNSYFILTAIFLNLFQDLFAVGYGQFEFSDQKSGLVCCWSLKNPEV